MSPVPPTPPPPQTDPGHSERAPTTRTHGPGRVRQVAVPSHARSESTLTRIDYADAFALDVDGRPSRSAEEWARAFLAEAPPLRRVSLIGGWTAIGLQLRRGENTVLGWTVHRSTPDVALLGARSRIGMPAQLLVKRRADHVLFCTFVTFGSRATRELWRRGVEPLHVRVVPEVLADVQLRDR